MLLDNWYLIIVLFAYISVFLFIQVDKPYGVVPSNISHYVFILPWTPVVNIIMILLMLRYIYITVVDKYRGDYED